MKIYTHDGTFHSDEVFAIALLKKFIGGKTEITRTRDEETLKLAKKDKSVYVIDVGGEYKESFKNFDHHQRSFKRTWEDNEDILLSSCGLVWKYLRKKGYTKKIHNDVLKIIEDDLIKKIDMHDNGIRKWALSSMISLCNREDNNLEDFEKAICVAEIYLDNIIYQETKNRERYFDFINDLKSYNPENRYFISQHTIKDPKVLNTISNDTNALFLIYPQHDDNNIESWMVKSVNRYDEDGNLKNAKPPEAWHGLTGKDLYAKSGVKGLLFVHKTGFLMGVKTKSQAIKVAEKIIKENYNDFEDPTPRTLVNSLTS